MVIVHMVCLHTIEQEEEKEFTTLRWIITSQISFWLWPLSLVGILPILKKEELSILLRAIKNEK